jgi:hypothetical protein
MLKEYHAQRVILSVGRTPVGGLGGKGASTKILLRYGLGAQLNAPESSSHSFHLSLTHHRHAHMHLASSRNRLNRPVLEREARCDKGESKGEMFPPPSSAAAIGLLQREF